ncbi:hypothetical protein ACFL0M_14545 [Thermodesulfobacteriota bacterium]
MSDKKPTLFLPKIEFENPLQWATLVHEMGHAVPDNISKLLSKEDYDNICSGSKTDQEIFKNWAEEIFCDLLSLHLLGPAYLASFIDFVTVKGHKLLENFSVTHPPPRYRIWLMCCVLRKKGISANFSTSISGENDLSNFFYALFENRCEVRRIYFKDFPLSMNTDKINIDARLFWNRMEEIVEKFVPFNESIPPFDQNKFKHLVSRLEKNIPIGAYSSSNLSDNTITIECLNDIEKIISTEKDEQNNIEAKLKKAFDTIRERPCTIAEIINAGWLYKCEKIYLQTINILNRFDKEQQNIFKDKLYRLDGLLRNSIETSYLTQLFYRPEYEAT